MATIITTSIFCIILGAIIGSFLGVCAYRIPMGKYPPEREGIKVLGRRLSITDPARSLCPNCEHQLSWWHNIPLISWIALGGRCAFCKSRIPFRYLLIELMTGILCMLCYWRFGPSLTAAVAFIFVSAMVVIVFIDLDYMIIPNVITYPGTVIGAVLVAVNQALQMQGSPLISEPFVASLIDSFYGLLAGPGVLLALWWFYRVVRKREGLGLGDVKLLAMIGVTFGPVGAWFTIFVGSVIGSVLGIIQVLARRIGFSQAVPFGPYLVIGFLFFLFDGPGLLARMLNHPEIPLLWWISQQR